MYKCPQIMNDHNCHTAPPEEQDGQPRGEAERGPFRGMDTPISLKALASSLPPKSASCPTARLLSSQPWLENGLSRACWHSLVT
ncbi:rCG58456, partial [Rattus norvegicus]